MCDDFLNVDARSSLYIMFFRCFLLLELVSESSLLLFFSLSQIVKEVERRSSCCLSLKFVLLLCGLGSVHFSLRGAPQAFGCFESVF